VPGIGGTLVQVGKGKILRLASQAFWRAATGRVAGMTAPAHGLVLVEVFTESSNLQPQIQRNPIVNPK